VKGFFVAMILGLAIAIVLAVQQVAQGEVSTPVTTGTRPHAIAGYADKPLTTGIPIDLSSGTPRTVFATNIGPVNPDDRVRVISDANVTNDTGVTLVNGVRKVTGTRYTVGVSYHIAYSTVSGAPTRAGTSMGENCPVIVHHCVVGGIPRMFKVPADWTPGTEMVVMMRVDAHSSAWAKNGGKELLRVEPYGAILFDVWAEASE
jgi:hypothetical protein